MPGVDTTITVRMRNVAGARFVLRAARLALHSPLGGERLARFIMRACYLRISVRPHQWRWSRVPFERVSDVSDGGAEESERA
jgi:hypothetical protein